MGRWLRCLTYVTYKNTNTYTRFSPLNGGLNGIITPSGNLASVPPFAPHLLAPFPLSNLLEFFLHYSSRLSYFHLAPIFHNSYLYAHLLFLPPSFHFLFLPGIVLVHHIFVLPPKMFSPFCPPSLSYACFSSLCFLVTIVSIPL